MTHPCLMQYCTAKAEPHIRLCYTHLITAAARHLSYWRVVKCAACGDCAEFGAVDEPSLFASLQGKLDPKDYICSLCVIDLADSPSPV